MMPVQPRIKVRVPRRTIPLSLIGILGLLYFMIIIEGKGETRADEIVIRWMFFGFILFLTGLIWRCIVWKIDVYYDRFIVANLLGVERVILFSQIAFAKENTRAATLKFFGRDGNRLLTAYLYCNGIYQLMNVVSEQCWSTESTEKQKLKVEQRQCVAANAEQAHLIDDDEEIIVRPVGAFLVLVIFFIVITFGSLYLLFTRGAFMEDYFPRPVVNWIVTVFAVLVEVLLTTFLVCHYAFTRLRVRGSLYTYTNWLRLKQEYDVREFSRVQVIRNKEVNIVFFVENKKVFSVAKGEKGYEQLWVRLLEEESRGNVEIL